MVINKSEPLKPIYTRLVEGTLTQEQAEEAVAEWVDDPPQDEFAEILNAQVEETDES